MSSGTVLGGDVGGTKVSLGIYRHTGNGTLALERHGKFPTGEYGGLEEVVSEFLRDGEPPEAAVFGVAGPVTGNQARLTNRPWRISVTSLEGVLGTRRIRLVNDVQAMGYGALFLPEDVVLELQRGEDRGGNRAIIAAGTGLGTAILVRRGDGSFFPVASEGGHVDFAPRSALEVELMRFVERETGRASYERIASGPGLVRIFRFLCRQPDRQPSAELLAALERPDVDAAAVVGRAAVAGRCPVAYEAAMIFARILGAQAGNLALTALATGGVYVGGGVAVRLRRHLEHPSVIEAFRAKDPHRGMMERIPVMLLLDPDTGRLGAARLAYELLGSAA